MERTPPPAIKSVSTSNLLNDDSYAIKSTIEDLNIIQRAKRPRADFSPASELKQLRDEIKSMFSLWKNESELTLNKVLSELAELKAHYQNIQKSNTEIEKALEFFNTQYEEQRHTIKQLENDCKENRELILMLENNLRDLKNSTKTSCIEIRNLPRIEKENTEELTGIVHTIGKTIGLNITSNEIRDIYRLPGKPDSARPIVVELQKVPMKNLLMTSIRDYNKVRKPSDKLNTQQIGLPGKSAPIYVGEHLLPTQRRLFFQAKEFAKKEGYKYCWITDGKILLRKNDGNKPIYIETEKTILHLDPKYTT